MSNIYCDPLDQISNCRVHRDGDEFEDKFEFAMRIATKNSKTYKIERASREMDKEEGTDFICGGIRLDSTLHFSGPNKNYMPYVCDSGIPSGVPNMNFKMGIRLANYSNRRYNEFPEPVVVFGLDMEPKDFHVWEDVIMDTISKRGIDIVDRADEVLLDFQTVNKEERKFINTPLKNNERIDKRDLEWLRKGNYSEIFRFREELEKGDDTDHEACLYFN